MSTQRDAILGRVKRSLGKESRPAEEADALNVRLSTHQRGILPKRGQGEHDQQVALFEAMAEEVSATTARVARLDDIPEAIGAYLKAQNLPAKIKMAPAAEFEQIDWSGEPLLEIIKGVAAAEDAVSLTPAFAGVAETGTLLLHSGGESPTTLNFLPDNHIVVLKAADIVGAYEEAWDKLRVRIGSGTMPRTVNFITGPSRTADIEQKIELGAHGPRRLHILVVDNEES